MRLNRNTSTGAISQPAGKAGCISQSGSGPCADGHALLGPSGVVVSPDGKSVYLDAYNSGAVARLNRNTTTGAISQPAGKAGCISQTGAGPCANGHALSPPAGVAVSRNGKSLYVTSYYRRGSSYTGAVARLNRNTTTGAISQPPGQVGCVSDKGAGELRQGSRATHPKRGRGQPGRKKHLRRFLQERRRSSPEAQSAYRGDQPAGRKSRLHQPDRRRALRRRACAPRPGVGGGQRRREECLRDVAQRRRGRSLRSSALNGTGARLGRRG